MSAEVKLSEPLFMKKNHSMATADGIAKRSTPEPRTKELEETNLRLRREIESQASALALLQAGERKYRELLDSAFDGIGVLRDEVLTYANPQLCAMLEMTAERLIGTSFTDYLAPEEQQRSIGLYRRMTRREAFPQRYETVLIRPSGARMEVGVSANIVDVDGVLSVVVVVHDISSQKKARQMAVENERLEAIRAMAHGVGNNFANILGVINSYAASIADSFLPNTRPHESARKIMDAARHAGELVKRLLGVVRVSGSEIEARVQPVEVGAAVRRACELISSALREKGISLDIQSTPDDLYGMADAGQLLDVLMNVLLNGADAISQGGALSVCYSVASSDRSVAADGKKDNYIQISITDTGIGMSVQQIAKVFEPFYTTKASRDAFGLGLSVAQSVVRSWGGQIEINSKPEMGTTVNILLVRSDAPPAAEDGNGVVEHRTVLLVDDHAERRQMMAQALEASGHAVIEAADGAQAINIYRERADEIDLVALDWIMPKADGREVLQVIHAHDPESKVLLMSGFSRDYVRSQIRMGAWAFIQQPFSAEQFQESVNKALGLTAK